MPNGITHAIQWRGLPHCPHCSLGTLGPHATSRATVANSRVLAMVARVLARVMFPHLCTNPQHRFPVAMVPPWPFDLAGEVVQNRRLAAASTPIVAGIPHRNAGDRSHLSRRRAPCYHALRCLAPLI